MRRRLNLSDIFPAANAPPQPSAAPPEGEPRVSCFPPRGKSRAAGIGVHLAALSQASIFFTQFFIIPCPINKKVMEQGIFAVMCELQESDLRIAITKLLCLNCNGHIPGY